MTDAHVAAAIVQAAILAVLVFFFAIPALWYMWLEKRNPQSEVMRWLGYYLKIVGILCICRVLGFWSLSTKGLEGFAAILVIVIIVLAVRQYNTKSGLTTRQVYE